MRLCVCASVRPCVRASVRPCVRVAVCWCVCVYQLSFCLLGSVESFGDRNILFATIRHIGSKEMISCLGEIRQKTSTLSGIAMLFVNATIEAIIIF